MPELTVTPCRSWLLLPLNDYEFRMCRVLKSIVPLLFSLDSLTQIYHDEHIRLKSLTNCNTNTNPSPPHPKYDHVCSCEA
jgi:hypothetical protein